MKLTCFWCIPHGRPNSAHTSCQVQLYSEHDEKICKEQYSSSRENLLNLWQWSRGANETTHLWGCTKCQMLAATCEPQLLCQLHSWKQLPCYKRSQYRYIAVWSHFLISFQDKQSHLTQIKYFTCHASTRKTILLSVHLLTIAELKLIPRKYNLNKKTISSTRVQSKIRDTATRTKITYFSMDLFHVQAPSRKLGR